MDILKEDYERFYVAKPDPGFSPARNKMVVEQSIEKYERTRKLKAQEYQDKLAERSNAVVSYLRSKAIDSDTPIEKYLGRRNLAYYQGQKIIEKIKNVNGQRLITFEEI